MGNVALVEPEAALLAAGAGLAAELPGAKNGLPPPKANSALSATALPGTLGWVPGISAFAVYAGIVGSNSQLRFMF